jgi:hypothetical protein
VKNGRPYGWWLDQSASPTTISAMSGSTGANSHLKYAKAAAATSAAAVARTSAPSL